jgi:hypothetical protein
MLLILKKVMSIFSICNVDTRASLGPDDVSGFRWKTLSFAFEIILKAMRKCHLYVYLPNFT